MVAAALVIAELTCVHPSFPGHTSPVVFRQQYAQARYWLTPLLWKLPPCLWGAVWANEILANIYWESLVRLASDMKGHVVRTSVLYRKGMVHRDSGHWHWKQHEDKGCGGETRGMVERVWALNDVTEQPKPHQELPSLDLTWEQKTLGQKAEITSFSTLSQQTPLLTDTETILYINGWFYK